MGGVSFVRLSPLIFRHGRHIHSHQESPIWKGLVCRNPSENYHLPPGGRSGRGWNLLFRVYFVQLYHIFVVVIVALIFVGNGLSEKDGWFAIPLGTFICVPLGEAGVG